MKRILSLILALALVFSFAGCDFFELEDEEEVFDVEEYIEEAEELVEEGDLEGAEKLLKKALRKAEDEDDVEELEACLELVQSMMYEDDPRKETAKVPTTAAPSTETQQPTGAIEQEITSGRNLLDNFDSNEMYKINVFLSNFSEQRFRAYPCSDYDLLMFGYMFIKINNREVLQSNSTHYYISKNNMDITLNRFFGRSVSLVYGEVLDERNYPITYQDSTYFFPGADGASVSYCSIATSMVDNGNGSYTVTFDVYGHQYPHESMSPYYSMTSAQAKNCSDLVYEYSGTAEVYDYIRDGGIETYQLLSYSHD